MWKDGGRREEKRRREKKTPPRKGERKALGIAVRMVEVYGDYVVGFG